ncbi:MAG: hypothetical protein QXP80_04820 [Zestosphaera sp.]
MRPDVLGVTALALRDRSFLAVLLACFLVLFVCLSTPILLPYYGDEEVYVRCGLDYVVNLTAPYTCNFEHPPLGKYLIGFLELLDFSRLAFLLLLACSSLLTFLITRNLVDSGSIAFLTASFLVLDTVFINTYRHLLLDPPAVSLLLLSLYLILVRDSLLLSSLFFGLSVACKLSVLPYSLVFTHVIVTGSGGWRASLRRLTVFVITALIAYLSTYVADLSLGFYSVIQHHVEMLTYMSWRHGFSLPMTANGLLKLVSKVEVWRYGGELSLLLTPVNTSFFTLANSTFTPGSSSYAIVGVGLGSLLWYATLPSLLINTYWALTRRLSSVEGVITLTGWVSLATVLPGPIDWYYINVLPALYMNVALTFSHLVRGESRSGLAVVASLTLAQALITLLTLFNVIPFEVSVFTR